MPRPYTLFLPFLCAVVACGDSPVGAPLADTPVDHVEAIVSGLVTDPDGNPVAGAYVQVSAICFPEPYQGCPMDQVGRTTDSEGRFLVRFEVGLQSSYPVQMALEATPPRGMGYVLGKATIEEFMGLYQPPPVNDTTSVRVVLPPNDIDSRRPIRVEPGYLRIHDVLGDAERFYMSGPGGVGAQDPATGEWLWEQGGLGGLAGPQYGLLGDRVVIASPGGLFAVRAFDGEPLWSRDGVPSRAITLSEPDGLYASEGGLVMAFDLATGATRWTRELIGSGSIVLAASAELVCAEILAYVECWEPATGERLWTQPMADFGSWLAITGSVVIMGSRTRWTAMDVETGQVVWELPLSSASPPVFSHDGTHAYACAAPACYAIRVTDGSQTWRTSFERYVSAPVVDGGSLYVQVGMEYGQTSLFVLDAATGAIQERILPDPFDYGFCGVPAVTSGYIGIRGCESFYTFPR